MQISAKVCSRKNEMQFSRCELLLLLQYTPPLQKQNYRTAQLQLNKMCLQLQRRTLQRHNFAISNLEVWHRSLVIDHTHCHSRTKSVNKKFMILMIHPNTSLKHLFCLFRKIRKKSLRLLKVDTGSGTTANFDMETRVSYPLSFCLS